MNSNQDVFRKLEIEAWEKLSHDEQKATFQQALAALGEPDLILDGQTDPPAGWLTFIVKHVPSGLRMQFVPGGSFVQGFSPEEEAALRDEVSRTGSRSGASGLHILGDAAPMRPTREVRVRPFVMTFEPLSAEELRSLLGLDEQAKTGLLPECLSSAVAEQIGPALAKHGLRIPSESEWEYAYRGGSRAPFPWGVELPEDPNVPNNQFDLQSMGEYSELVADGYHPDYTGAPDDGSARDPGGRPRVARGGAAEVWPWQGVGEWVSMLSAFRSPSSQHDGFLRVRAARSFTPGG